MHKAKKGQQIWLRRKGQISFSPITTGQYLKETRGKIFLKDLESDLIMAFDKNKFLKFFPVRR
jgi:hypothetical protein